MFAYVLMVHTRDWRKHLVILRPQIPSRHGRAAHVYHRKLVVDKVYIPQSQYEPTRKSFEEISARDSHLIALKHVEAVTKGISG